MTWKDKIILDPNILQGKLLQGKPIIKGTRISVEFILELLANKWTYNQILENYPQLKPDDLFAAL